MRVSNQVNNLIGFPYIFRGALDVRAKTINGIDDNKEVQIIVQINGKLRSKIIVQSGLQEDEILKIVQKDKQNFKSIIGEFRIENSKGIIEILRPELRIYNQPNITTSEADIKTTLMKDKFIVINLVQNQDFFNVRYQVKPFMLWIWLSVILISFGGIVSFLQKRS